MNSLPRLAPLCLLTASLALTSCATPANRRALYFSSKPKGPWTNYELRREAEAQTGVSTTTTTTQTVIGPVTPQPRSAPVPALPPVVTPPEPVPAAPPAATPAPTAAPAPDATAASPAVTPAP